MRGGRFGTGMNFFMSVHRQTLEADHAARARERARAMEDAMRRATPSDALGHGRLATLGDVLLVVGQLPGELRVDVDPTDIGEQFRGVSVRDVALHAA